MKRTIVALAALGMLVTAGSVRAGQFGNIDLYGQYVETFQGPTTGTPIAGYCVLTFDGISALVPPASECFIVNGSGASLQQFCSSSAPTYNINSDGTGSISGNTTTGSPASCPSPTPFNEKVVIQELTYSPYVAATNVEFIRTDTGYVASGSLVPQTGGPYKNSSLYGPYTELASGTQGGLTFAGVCLDNFNGLGSLTGSCTINIATIGACYYTLAGTYSITSTGAAAGGGFDMGTLTKVAPSPGACPTGVAYGELLRILNGNYSLGQFTGSDVTAVNYETGVIATGTYLQQN